MDWNIKKYCDVVISVDPATSKKVALSIWEDQKIWRVVRVKPDGLLEQFREFQVVYAGRSVLVVIEDQYLDKNFRSAKLLVEQRARIEGWCDMVGFEHVSVLPSVWQGAILRTFAQKSEERKRRALVVAKGILGMRNDAPLDDNLADAVCIGQWAVTRMMKLSFVDML